jgi:hypothetical protein
LAGWAPGPVWTGAENLTPTGIQSPDRPAHSWSIYAVPAHIIIIIIIIIIIYSNNNFNGKYWAIFGPKFSGPPG